MLDSSYDGHNIVFLIGSGRSGTTWLQRLLATHPLVLTGQESCLFLSYIGPQLRAWRRELRTLSTGRGGTGLRAYLREEEFLSIVKGEMLQFMEPMVGQLPADHLFLEKTPSHALFIPEILQMLPKARFIHILRDGRDVVASFRAASKTIWKDFWHLSAYQASRLWVQHIEAVRSAQKKLSPVQFYEVRYEQLLDSPQLVLQDICRFLGLQWKQEDLLEAIKRNEAKAAPKTATPIPLKGDFADISGPEVKHPVGFIRKAKSGSWKQDLSPTEKIVTWIVASRRMAVEGYPWILPWL
jgi:hypothetical protein